MNGNPQVTTKGGAFFTDGGQVVVDLTNGRVLPLPIEEVRDQLLCIGAESLEIATEEALATFRDDPEYVALEEKVYIVEGEERLSTRFRYELLAGNLSSEDVVNGTVEEAVLNQGQARIKRGAIGRTADLAAELTGYSKLTTRGWLKPGSTIRGPASWEKLDGLAEHYPFFREASEEREDAHGFVQAVNAFRGLEYRVQRRLQNKPIGGEGEGGNFDGLKPGQHSALADRLAERILSKHLGEVTEQVKSARAMKPRQHQKSAEQRHTHPRKLRRGLITDPAQIPGSVTLTRQEAYDVYTLVNEVVQTLLYDQYHALTEEWEGEERRAYQTHFQEGVTRRLTLRKNLSDEQMGVERQYSEGLLGKGAFDQQRVERLINQFTHELDSGVLDERLGLAPGSVATALKARGEYARAMPEAVFEYETIRQVISADPLPLEGKRATQQRKIHLNKIRKLDQKSERFAAHIKEAYGIDVTRRRLFFPHFAQARALDPGLPAEPIAYWNRCKEDAQATMGFGVPTGSFYTRAEAGSLLDYAGVKGMVDTIRINFPELHRLGEYYTPRAAPRR